MARLARAGKIFKSGDGFGQLERAKVRPVHREDSLRAHKKGSRQARNVGKGEKRGRSIIALNWFDGKFAVFAKPLLDGDLTHLTATGIIRPVPGHPILKDRKTSDFTDGGDPRGTDIESLGGVSADQRVWIS